MPQKGFRQYKNYEILNLKRASVNYSAKTKIKETQTKKKRLNDIYMERFKIWANNQITSERSSRKIKGMSKSIKKQNEKDNKGKQLTIHYTTINRYLK